jgi:hypothetical protein
MFLLLPIVLILIASGFLLWEEITNITWQTFREQFWPQVIATIIGIAIGIPVAVWISRFQERSTEQERRTRIIISLRDEIEVNLDSLDRGKWDEDDYTKGTLSARLKTETWDAFSDGG